MFENVQSLLDEYAELERELADPAVHADAGKSPQSRVAATPPSDRSSTRIVSGSALVTTSPPPTSWPTEDESFAGEAERIRAEREDTAERLQHLLIPRDPDDDRDVILEVKAGEGGDESALFAGDLLRMYLRYAERQGWKTEVLDAQESDLGGYKDAAVAVKTKGVAEPGAGVWSRLKYEGGVHRVQRVPVTESQGRIHTSAAGVLVSQRPRTSKWRSIPTTCASTCIAAVVRVARV